MAARGKAAERVTLRYDGDIVPYVRTRRGSRRTNRYAAAYFACKEAMAWTWKIQWGARALLGAGLRIGLDIIVAVPPARLWRQDADNLGKGVCDSLLGVVLEDDRFVSDFRVTKVPARPIVGQAPGATVHVTWTPLSGGEEEG